VSAARYRRDRTGEVVHRSDCRTLGVGQGSDWNYADGMTADEMLRTIAANRWLRPCKVCKPTQPSRDEGAMTTGRSPM
jgi:hypothetical protein